MAWLALRCRTSGRQPTTSLHVGLEGAAAGLGISSHPGEHTAGRKQSLRAFVKETRGENVSYCFSGEGEDEGTFLEKIQRNIILQKHR